MSLAGSCAPLVTASSAPMPSFSMSFSSSTSQSQLVAARQRLGLLREVGRRADVARQVAEVLGEALPCRERRAALDRGRRRPGAPAGQAQRELGEALALVLLALELVEAVGGIGRHRCAVQQRPVAVALLHLHDRPGTAPPPLLRPRPAPRTAARTASRYSLGPNSLFLSRARPAARAAAAMPGTSCSNSVEPRRPSRSPRLRMRARWPLDARSMALAAPVSSPALEHAQPRCSRSCTSAGAAAFVLNSTSHSCFRESIEIG